MIRRLTEHDLWRIVTADQLSARELAGDLGVSEHAVRVARWRLRRDGWTCAVTYGPCRRCGRPLTIRSRRIIDAYHPACWHAEVNDQQRRTAYKRRRP